MNEEVKLFKLISGEEVIARATPMTDGDWSVRNAHTVAVNHQNGSVGLMSFSAIAGATQSGTIYKQAVMADLFVTKELEDKFLAQVSGITLAKA